jgi:tRNA (guanine-N7-)-methyltransferase
MQDLTTENAASERPFKQRQLYGRRVGRGMTDFLQGLLEARLPELKLDITAPQPLSALFGPDISDVWLEIGFGGGEHLAWQAETHPEIGIIGCEPFLTGVAKLLYSAEEAGLRNLRLYDDDARHILQWLPEASVARAFILFPDPWPKKRHRKRRFLNEAGLGLLARIMRPGAELRFATDIADYARMVSAAVKAQGDFSPEPGLLAERPADWPLTRYAEKAIAAGRECRFFIYTRR